MENAGIGCGRGQEVRWRGGRERHRNGGFQVGRRIQEGHEASAGIGVGARTRVRCGIRIGELRRGGGGGINGGGTVEGLLRIVEEGVVVERRGDRWVGEGPRERRCGVR